MPYTDESHGMAHWGDIIKGDSPCGEDLSLDPEFESLSDEIGKDKSLHGDQKTDWVVVYKLSDSLLRRSKDLWPFVYGIVAVYKTKSIDDCVSCVNSLVKLLSTQWKGLYPSLERPKRRIAPLKWLCDKFHSIRDSTAFLGISPKDISALNTVFVELQEKIDSLLPNNDLAFRSILHAQMESGQRIPPKPEQAGHTATSKISSPASKQAAQPLRNTPEEVERSSNIPSAALPQVIRTINDNARQLGDHLLALNRVDERAYQLHRVAIWSTLLQLPPSDTNGLTQLSCPIPPEMIDMYTTAVNDKRYVEILPQVERAASKAPFWLDGQHLVVRCLEGMSATLPAHSVKHSLAQLIKRFPDIISLKFKDGRPFASPKTATWIDSFLPVIFSSSPLGTGGQVVASNTAQADESKQLKDAIALSVEDDFKAGLNVLGKVPPGKTRAFLRHCVLKAKYCAAAGQPQAATHILKSMIDKLKIWDLLDWEPELTAEAVSLLLSLLPKQKSPDEELQALLYTISLETAISAK